MNTNTQVNYCEFIGHRKLTKNYDNTPHSIGSRFITTGEK